MDGDLPLAKRPRLSMACNECRRRKVKCDTDVPRCQNCRLRNDVCTTTDPKRPSVAISREWIEQTETPRINQVNQHTMSRNIISSQSPRALPAAKGSANYSPRSIAATVSCTEEKGPSPAQQPYDMAFNMDNSTDRIKMMGASSSQCLMKSLDVYLESAQIPSLSGNFRYGMRQAEEMEIPLLNSFPALPEPDCLNRYVTAFFDRIHRLYPLFDIDKIKDTIRHFASMRDFHSLTPDNIPLLVSAYLIVSLGADEEAEQLTDDGTKYLVAAASLVGHIILVPYLSTVQALLLFTIAYRGRNKDGVGWQMLGMAIRISYTLGLHRHSAKNPSIEHGVQLHSKQLFHARIWAICCSFEMMMQLESGRPSMIQEVDRDHMMGPDQHPRGHDFLQWHMGLAQHQRLISHHIYGHRPGDRTGREILSDTARLDRSLLSWARDIPEEFRPGNDLFCSTHEFHIAALLSVQYYQTVIALHRAALISPAPTFLSEVASHCFDDSLSLRLQAGEAICVSSARSIARLAIELSDRKIQSRILNAGPPLLACIVLGISLMKNPAGRIMASDLEVSSVSESASFCFAKSIMQLLKACAEYTADQFLQTGHNALFANGA